MQHLQWRWVRPEILGHWAFPQTYIIPSLTAVWVEHTGRIQANSSARSCKPAEEAWGYLEPHLDMDSRPSSAYDHQVTLLQAHEFNLIIKQ